MTAKPNDNFFDARVQKLEPLHLNSINEQRYGFQGRSPDIFVEKITQIINKGR